MEEMEVDKAETALPTEDRKIFCWGLADSGQLGLGNIEEKQIVSPQEIVALRSRRVRNISCGPSHTVFVLEGGTIYTCGDNDTGQLGHDKSCWKPEVLDALETRVVRLVASGKSHNVAITDEGHVFSWGDNSQGQLGRGFTDQVFTSTPKWVRLPDKVIIQAMCGSYHTLVLSDDGYLFSWGSNSSGELGHGFFSPKEDVPKVVTSLKGLPVAHIACGASHNFVLTKSGALFGWGKNRSGQLGIGDEKDRFFPTHVKTLRSQKIKYVACGQDHTAALTEDGGVFTFGDGMYGQLGHNSKHNELLPKKVFELMGSVVTQIACGRFHTLALVPSRGSIYAFGLGSSGQLGIGICADKLSPVCVKASFSHPRDSGSQTSNGGYRVKKLFSGGDQCFVIVTSPKDAACPDDFRTFSKSKQILYLSDEKIDEFVSVRPQGHPSTEMKQLIYRLFSSQACINASFLPQGDLHYNCGGKKPGVELELACHLFARLGKLPNGKLTSYVNEALEKQLIPDLGSTPPDVETLRVYLTLPYCHLFNNPACFSTVICPFGKAVISLDKIPARIIDLWWGKLTSDHFTKLVVIYKAALLHIIQLPITKRDTEVVTRLEFRAVCLEILKKLKIVNEENGHLVPYEQFYIPELKDKVDIRAEYIGWLQQRHGQSSSVGFLCNYPFVFDGEAKTLLLQTDALIQMQVAVDEVCRRNLTSFFLPTIDPVNPCLLLCVSRDNLLQDTLVQLSKYRSHDFKKPLKVLFRDEEAMDAGGVRKEFFLFLMKEITDPKYGMFTYYEDSRQLWFNEQTFEDRMMFLLIGLVCGLAIYNSTIIELHFPLALYKKLLNKKVTLDDMKDLEPVVGRSLQELLDYDGDDIEDTFCLNFEITKEVFGEVKKIELRPGGASVVVNKGNRQEYVEEYIDYVFNTSVKDQFTAFYKGFHEVCGGRVLELFQAKELQAMVVGNENFDWEVLEQDCEYKGEYNKNHTTIQMFWSVFKELSLEQKRKFILFLTGSDRIPIHGMKSLKMIIQPMSVEQQFLPVAHTCFNILDLPKYSNRELLKQKLLQALDNAQGFGLV